MFTLIVLGESILASSNAIVGALEEAEHYGDLILLAATGFVIVACLWWLYFAFPQHGHLTSLRRAVVWGYGHFFIFAAAAVSAGIAVAVDYDTRHTGLDAARAAATLCVPVAVFVLAMWLLTARPSTDVATNVAAPIVAALVLVSIFLPYSLQVTAVLLVVLVVLVAWRSRDLPVHEHWGANRGGARREPS